MDEINQKIAAIEAAVADLKDSVAALPASGPSATITEVDVTESDGTTEKFTPAQ